MTRPSRVALVGPPGAGKATLGPYLAKLLGVPLVSAQALVTASVRAGDPHGIGDLGDSPDALPDHVLTELVVARVDPAGFILDGFPRSVTQARALDEHLPEYAQMELVLELVVPDEVVSARLSRRARMEDRTDDSPETVAARLVAFHRGTPPLLAHYAGRCRRVAASGDIEEVFRRADLATASIPGARA